MERNIYLIDMVLWVILSLFSRMEFCLLSSATKENTETNFYCAPKLVMCICLKITY